MAQQRKPQGNKSQQQRGKSVGTGKAVGSRNAINSRTGKYAGKSAQTKGSQSKTASKFASDKPPRLSNSKNSFVDSERSSAAGNIIEGRHAVYEALIAQGEVPIERILIATGIKEDESVTQILEAAAAAKVPVKYVQRSEIERKSAHGSHQGIIAHTKKFEYSTLARVIAKAEGKENALIIALDHVTDPGNFGAIARSAEIVGACGIVVCSKRSAPVTAVAHKASAGALSHIPVARETNLAAALKTLKDAGFWVAGASEKAEQNIWEAPLDGRIVLVMGAEGTGLARLTQDNCDFLISLPQAGKIGSLNVAQATTAIAYEWLRRSFGHGI